MSLISLNSGGDLGGNPSRFSNYFPNPIIFQPNSQIALLNIVVNPNGQIHIIDNNNTFYFRIGEVMYLRCCAKHAVIFLCV